MGCSHLPIYWYHHHISIPNEEAYVQQSTVIGSDDDDDDHHIPLLDINLARYLSIEFVSSFVVLLSCVLVLVVGSYNIHGTSMDKFARYS